ncbi:MAG TPA: hypothetical protein VHG52_03230, partial [Thermomicrobiales bacterium]|nr:hypothetical protein [Thermomicrobiales bacterium]
DDLDPSAGLSQESDEGPRLAEGKDPSRQRAEPHNVPRSSPGRPPPDNRRKRANEQRYAGWGDGIERAWCARAEQFLPETFPVASHTGAATIRAAVVARRPDRFLICTFSHHGPHHWPDGELVDDEPVKVATSRETEEDPGRSQLK